MEQLKPDFDVVIIGGGPAGLSAALGCFELGLKAMLYEKEGEFGGQLLRTFNVIKNYLGIEAADGRELADKFIRQLNSLKVPIKNNSTVTGVDLERKIVTLGTGEQSSARTVIIATGVRRKRLGVSGEVEFEGRGVLHSGVDSKSEVVGKTVVIVGGGDAAIENAIVLGETARNVVVIHRKGGFTARKEFVDRAMRQGNIEFVYESEVCSINGNEVVSSIEIVNVNDGRRTSVSADAVLIRIGVVPNTDMFRGQIDMDATGYILVDASNAASRVGIFAVGDAANPISPTISTAVGSGATAAKASSTLINDGFTA
ncbi:thioredoxin-disulfide reductase [soil metagenome]